MKNQSIVKKKNPKSSKKRKEGVTFDGRNTKTKKKQKVISKSMKSIQDVCGSTGNFGKLLFDALVKDKYIDPTWKTNKVEFYDTVEPNTPLSFAYGRVGVIEGCEKENILDYDLSDVYWVFTGCSKH